MSKASYRSVDIDFEVYQLIVLEKRGFDEADNDVLRRLLGLSESSGPSDGPTESWQGKGVELPNGTRLRMTHGGTEYRGTIVERKWNIGDEYFNTPSQAASGVARTKQGRKTMLNGWKYWYIKRPVDTSWVLLDTLRHDPRS